VPGFTAIDKIYRALTGKTLAVKSYTDGYQARESDMMKSLSDIPSDCLKKWNAIHHRKNFSDISDKIIEIANNL
jgi:hypothetical protein